MDLYNAGLDSWKDWTSETFVWSLWSALTFNPDDATVGGITGTEISVSGYARVSASSKVRTVSNSTDRINYTAANPDFGTLTTGQNVVAVLLHQLVTNDSDNIPVGYQLISTVDTGAVDPFLLTLTAGLVCYMDDGG